MDTDAYALVAPEPAPRLAVQLLGTFGASVDGTAVPPARWPSLRATQLVQLLSLQPRGRLPREQLIDALWPRLEPEAGAANLRKAVHHARQALGRHDAILVQGGEVQLWPAGETETDARQFEAAATRARGSRDAAACAEAAQGYGGDLLPGSQYEAWTEASREHLRALHLDLLRLSAQWERVARLEPTDEAAHRALMQQELEAGNRAGALRWYAHLREALQHTLGVVPDAATERLYARCVAALQPTGPALVGRALPLAQVRAWLALPPAERPGAVALRGDAGMGKSALLREIAVQAGAQGLSVLTLDASQSGRTYALVGRLAEQLVLSDRSLLDRVGVRSRAVLAQITPVAKPMPALEGPLGRHQVVGAVRRLLLCAAGGVPLLLAVDDAHLVDAADVDVLLQLVVAGAPLCVLLAMRDPAAGSALAQGIARLHRAGALQVLDLPPLDADECRRLVSRVCPVPLDAQQLAHIERAADGNAFAAIELARCAAMGPSRALPASAAEAITARLCDVPAAALALLQWVALCGDDLEVSTIEALAQEAQVPQLAALDDALAAGVLVPHGARCRFRHALVRQALIEQITPPRRQRMHRQLAARLAELDAAPAVVAQHWQAAGRPREALPWWLAAAREALGLAAFRDVLHHLEPLLAADAAHAEALRLRAEALDALGEPAALAAYRAAAQVADSGMRDDLLAKAALAQVKQGDPKGGVQALEGLQPVSVEGRLSEALAYAGAAALGATDPALGTAKSAAARRLALESGDTSALVIASWAQAAAAHARGELHHSVWADLHETRDVPHLALRVFDGHLCITQRFLYGARPYAEVIAFANALATEAQRLGAGRGHAFGTTLRGEAEWLAGDLAHAREDLHDGVRLHRAIGGPVGEALSLQRLAELALHEGRQHDARSLLGEALDVARQTDIGFHLLDRIYGTRIRLHDNDPAAALYVLEDASESVRGPLETCPGCRITFAVPAAIAAARAGEVDLAQAHAQQCAYLADVVMRLPAWYAAHDEVRGHLAAAQPREQHHAAGFFAAAAARFAAAGHPLDAQRCRARAAR